MLGEIAESSQAHAVAVINGADVEGDGGGCTGFGGRYIVIRHRDAEGHGLVLVQALQTRIIGYKPVGTRRGIQIENAVAVGETIRAVSLLLLLVVAHTAGNIWRVADVGGPTEREPQVAAVGFHI